MAPGVNSDTPTSVPPTLGMPGYMKALMATGGTGWVQMQEEVSEDTADAGDGELVEYVVDFDRVAVRETPSTDSSLAAALVRGETFEVSKIIREAGEEWLKIPRGTKIEINRKSQVLSRTLPKDAYVLSVHPELGRLVKPVHVQVSVKEVQEEGILSKEERQKILEDCQAPKELVIPLEAKTWSKQEFTHYVLSGGMIRPKGCSIPDATFMLNTDMTQSEIESALAQAAAWIVEADAVLIGSGAGMGVDSGLATFRGGKAGVWPGLEAVGLAYEEICDPKWFLKEPELAWAFWNFCHKAYQDTKPHQGYELVRQWADRAPLGAFSFTSNIDSHWITSGWDHRRICEVHGAVSWLQCSRGCCPDVWVAPKDLGLKENPKTHRVEGDSPVCRKCGKPARPCVQMFGGDQGFAKGRRNLQITRYDGWLKKLAARHDAGDLRVVCIELGCGLTVPTVRKELESVVRRFKGGRLIRVNPENPGLAQELKDKGVSLPLAAGASLRMLDPMVAVDSRPITLIAWDEVGGGIEIATDSKQSIERMLRCAEGKDGVEIEYHKTKPPQFYARNPFNFDLFEAMGRGSVPSENFIFDLSISNHRRRKQVKDYAAETQEVEGAEKEETSPLKLGAPGYLHVVMCRNVRFTSGLHKSLAARCDQVESMLDDLTEKFSAEEYQENVRKQKDRRGVQQMVKDVQSAVLPKYGLPKTDKGVFIMQALCGTSIIGNHARFQAKADASMVKSYILESMKLPAIVKEEKVKEEKAVEKAEEPTPIVETTSEVEKEKVEKEKVEKPEPPKPTPLKAFVTQLGVDNPMPIELKLMTSTTVAELRAAIANLLGLESRSAKNVKLVMKLGGHLASMKPGECVRAEMFINGLEEDDFLRLKEMDLATDALGDDVSADNSADSRDKSFTIDALKWETNKKWVRLKMSPNTLVSEFREELQKKLRYSKDRCRKMKFIHSEGDQFLPLKDHDNVKPEILVRDLGDGEPIERSSSKKGQPKSPIPPLPPGWPQGVLVHCNFVFHSMSDEEKEAWASFHSTSFWNEWNKVHSSELFRRSEDEAFRNSIWKQTPNSKGRKWQKAEAHHALNDPILRYYAAEDPLLLGVWFEFSERANAGAQKAPAKEVAVDAPVKEAAVEAPAEEDIVREELHVRINLDAELELSMDFMVQSGTTIYELKQKLASAAISGGASAEDFQLGLPSSSGDIFPLADNTRLSRKHLELEVIT
mmetsp:Transcript_127089/g.244948  ORF Transcript_127089/g.244948 Transcript_127089/m.244948 type:complete len:1218 (+) Transcript_127089:123-3776(+)